MKILVAYISATGNTEKVAKAIKEGITGQEVDLLDINGVKTLFRIYRNHFHNHLTIWVGTLN